MYLIFCLLIPLAALLMLLPRRWEHPWKLRLPLGLLRGATVDSALLAQPLRMTAAHLPFEPIAQPRLQSGALLWASAALVTHSLAEEPHRAAILEAVKPLGFTPEKFLARCPIQQQVQCCGMQGYIVRDGNGQRAYFTGEPAALLGCCETILDQQERPVAPEDLRRLPSGDILYGLATAPVKDGAIGPMIYLGSMEIAAPAMDPAQVQALLPHGWGLEVDDPADFLTLDISANPQGVNSFTAATPDWQEQLAAGLQRTRRAPQPRVVLAIAWLLLWPVLMDFFTQYVLPGSPALLMGLPPAVACLWANSANSKLLIPCNLVFTAILWLLLQPGAIAAAFCLVAGLLHGLVARLILPVECS